MLVTGLILWASLLTGAWPATHIQDQLPATPRVRLSFKGKRLGSSLKPSFLTVLVLLQRNEEQAGHRDNCVATWVLLGKQDEREEAGLAGKSGTQRTQAFWERILSWALDLEDLLMS